MATAKKAAKKSSKKSPSSFDGASVNGLEQDAKGETVLAGTEKTHDGKTILKDAKHRAKKAGKDDEHPQGTPHERIDALVLHLRQHGIHFDPDSTKPVSPSVDAPSSDAVLQTVAAQGGPQNAVEEQTAPEGKTGKAKKSTARSSSHARKLATAAK